MNQIHGNVALAPLDQKAVLVSGSGALEDAVADIGSDERTIYLTGDTTVVDDLTIPANISLVPWRDYPVSVASGKTLTVPGVIEAGHYQIFTGDGDVAVTYQRCPLEWFGAAVAASAAANTTAINKAIASAKRLLVTGNYNTNGDHEFIGHTDMLGEARVGGSGFTLQDSPTNGIFYTPDDAYTGWTIRLLNLTFSGWLQTGDGLLLSGVSPQILNCGFGYLDNAIRLKSCIISELEVLSFANSDCGVFLDDSVQTYNAHTKIRHAHASACINAVKIRHASRVNVDDFSAEGLTGSFVTANNQYDGGPAYNFANCSTDGCNDAPAFDLDGDEQIWQVRISAYSEGNGSSHADQDVVQLGDVGSFDIEVQRLGGDSCVTGLRTTADTGTGDFKAGPVAYFDADGDGERADSTAYEVGDRFWTDNGTERRWWVVTAAAGDATSAAAQGTLYNEPVYGLGKDGAVVTDGNITAAWSAPVCPYTPGSVNYRSGAEFVLGDTEVGGDLFHSGSLLGFFDTAAIAKPEVTGVAGSADAQASLISALAALGLITDSTT